tara:strand:+ start:102 stop:1958 length:1857 start_codon:yes stop_codon:yes gene_type:complete
MKVLGISAYYHDSAAALIIDGEIIAAVQEERFSRKKHDSNFPRQSLIYCLESNNLSLLDIDIVIYYEKPLLTFERLLETHLGVAPKGFRSFIKAIQVWLKKKLFIKAEIRNQLKSIQEEIFNQKINRNNLPKLLFSEHHLSHASAAFYPSPFKDSAILCLDGVGEWATTSAWYGNQKRIKPIWEISFPHSLGLIYSAFTYYCGFKVNSGEYKLMGLAPYGKPIYAKKIKENLIDIKKDGSFRLDMSFFKYHRGLRMTSSKFNKLFKNPPREKESELTQFYMDIAASIQLITEEIVILLAKSLKKETSSKNLTLAGGVALNCVANGKLLKENIFENIWIQPAAGDAGSAIGAALLAYYENSTKKRIINPNDSMKGAYLGPKYENSSIKKFLDQINAKYYEIDDSLLFKDLASYLDSGNIIGWFNGPMEFGPRALGARSIIGDPRDTNMQKKMNLKIKYRESFRPFAPSILEEDVHEQFELNSKSPYMLLVSNVKESLCLKMNDKENRLFGIKKLNIPKSTIPSVTHVDYSARIQTVSKRTNPRYYNLIKEFKSLTGCPSIINTSFNVRGEPIVCTPEDAYKCFMRTEMDILVLQNQVLFKKDQPKMSIDKEWMKEFELD